MGSTWTLVIAGCVPPTPGAGKDVSKRQVGQWMERGVLNHGAIQSRPWACSIGMTWGLVRHAHFQAPPRSTKLDSWGWGGGGGRNLSFLTSPGDSYAYIS